MFSLRSNFFDFAMLSPGQFLANDGEKAKKKQVSKVNGQGYSKDPFHSVTVVFEPC